MKIRHEDLATWAETQERELVAKSYALADGGERKARLSAIIALSAELERIRAINIFATALGEGAIEAVIEGDWEEVMGFWSQLDFNLESDGGLVHCSLWARFREILHVESLLARRRAAAETQDVPMAKAD
jgi:hypothetical protein